MNFVVVATQQRYRVKKRCGEPVAFIFREKPVCKVFKEQFATRGGAEAFKEIIERQHLFKHPREIPGRTKYAVLPVADAWA